MQATTACLLLALLFASYHAESLAVHTDKENAADLQEAYSSGAGVHFVDIDILAGENLERRPPRVGEEMRVEVRIRNDGPATIYYLPTLCDTSLAAVFDSDHVRIETGLPRCLAASMPTPLRSGEDAVVSAPESGTVYVAKRGGSTSAIVVFTYHMDQNMDPSTQRTKQATFNFAIEDGFDAFSISVVAIAALLLGAMVALELITYRRRSMQRIQPKSLDRSSGAVNSGTDLYAA